MDKRYFSPINESKNLFQSKPTMSKKQSSGRQSEGIFSSSSVKKYIPDQDSSRLILNYFQFNNFQDFNTWQQIAKTKTEYKFEESSNGKFECELIFKWQSGLHETMIFKSQARSKKNAKKKALILLIEGLMFKGLIGQGFKQKNFVEKLPRRKKYESSSQSEEDIPNEANNSKKQLIMNLIKERNSSQQQILANISIQNAYEIWSYSLSQRSMSFCSRVLTRILGSSLSIQIPQQKSCLWYDSQGRKQVSYVEQFKDPFQEDLTVFIRYYQLQRPQFSTSNFNLHHYHGQKENKVTLPSLELQKEVLDNTIMTEKFREFRTIQQITDKIGKKRMNIEKKVKTPFFQELQNIILPKFQQDSEEKQFFPLKLIEKMFNEILYLSLDYQLAMNVLNLLTNQIQHINFLQVNPEIRQKSQEKISASQEQKINKNAQKYYVKMKKNLLSQMLYNLNTKIKLQKVAQNLSIEGMLNFSTSHSKYQSMFHFVSKEPEEITLKKIQKKNNLNEFFEQNQFCTQQVVLLVNKLTQSSYVGTICQLSQNFKIYVPHLLFQSECDFPAPFTIYKLLNNKIYNKLSTSLLHVCKHYIQLVNYEIYKNKNVSLIVQTPSGPHLQIINELLAENVSKKLFILIVSENYQLLHKALTDKGFKCLKVTLGTDEKIVSKSNIILASPLNVCMDSMKNIAFDRVIIDEAQRVPEIISLLSIIKCTKKLYLIGDPNLPRGEMKSPQSKRNQIQKSLFEKYIQRNTDYITFTAPKPSLDDNQPKKWQQQRVFDSSIVEWLKLSVYGDDIFTENQDTMKRKTPSIKGFNWPSNDYRLCFINSQSKENKFQKWVNKQCELIVWIIAEVLRSGFTELQQITCCCLDSKFIPLLQKHLLRILIKMNIQPLQWPMVFQSLIRPLSGSIWSSNDLIIVLAINQSQPNEAIYNLKHQKKVGNDIELGKKLNSALLQAERGLIVIGDAKMLATKSQAWGNFIDWMAQKKLILSYTNAI